MPNRVIREVGLISRKLAAASDFAERLYWRLFQAVDDFGRFHGDARIILGRCFSLMTDRVKPRQVQKGRDELARLGLILLYRAGDDEIVQITKWDQRVRASESKFPAPDDGQMTVTRPSNDGSDEDVDEDVDVNRESKTKTVRPLNAGPSCVECHAALEELNRQTGRHYTGSGEGLRMLHARHQEHGMPAVLRVIRVKVGAWMQSPKWSKYLRPETLFRPTKFDSYLNEPDPVALRAHDALPPLPRTDLNRPEVP